MQSDKASEIINNNISYRDGWEISAAPAPLNTGEMDFMDFMELLRLGFPSPSRNVVLVRVEAELQDSDKRYAPKYERKIYGGIPFTIDVSRINTETELAAEVLKGLLRIELHEAREFFKWDGKEYEAPFHPHTENGEANWRNLLNINI